jgi:hypothetical protein
LSGIAWINYKQFNYFYLLSTFFILALGANSISVLLMFVCYKITKNKELVLMHSFEHFNEKKNRSSVLSDMVFLLSPGAESSPQKNNSVY